MASSYMLGSHFESFIKNLVESGRYASAREVMRDSLRPMQECENTREAKLDALRASISEGLVSGPADPLDMNDIKAAARDARRDRKIAS